ncbi:HDIG domain-containing protein [bacterium]|nr:HDIG domain-containing protein [candidate division CSSED10-310 bacterium]
MAANGSGNQIDLEDDANATTSVGMKVSRLSQMRVHVIGSIVAVTLLVFLSFLELFIQPMELPAIGSRAQRTLRAPIDFTFQGRAVQVPAEKFYPRYKIDEETVRSSIVKFEEIFVEINSINGGRVRNSDRLWELFGQQVDTERLKRFKRISEKLTPVVKSIISPVLRRGIVARGLIPEAGRVLVRDAPLDDGSEVGFRLIGPESLPDVSTAGKEIMRNFAAVIDLDENAIDLLNLILKVTIASNLVADTTASAALPETETVARASRFFRRGEVIVPRGKIIDELDVAYLQACGEGRHYPLLLLALAMFIPFQFIVTFFIVYNRTFHEQVFLNAKNYLVIFLIMIAIIAIMKPIIMFTGISPYAVPIGAVTLLTVYLVHRRNALFTVAVTSLLLTLFTEFSLSLFLYYLICGSLALIFALRCTSLRQLVVCSGFLGAAHVVVMTCMQIMSNRPFLPHEFRSLAIQSFAAGTLWLGGLAFLPLFEKVFDITTDFRLMEFNDLNHPLMKELLNRAPGSYHHSVATGNLAGLAADAIGANPLRARVGGYFHDIGKLHKPEYFMENITDGGNPHANLSPLRSIDIIKGHVVRGIEIGKKCGLPSCLIAFVAEHHGTTMLESFYYKTMKDDLNKDIPQEFFRYMGQKPGTIESALVMIADSVEAISRVVSQLTEQRAESIIREVIKNKFLDAQFEYVPLTTQDIERITMAMSQALVGLAHKRKRYPDFVKSR